MRILLDTNILLRIGEKSHIHHAAAVESLKRLISDGHVFCIGSQTISEFLAVATRSLKDRGLAMGPAEADAEFSKVTAALDVLYDSAETVTDLRRLVVTHAVTGKSVHDAKLVAAMNTSGVRDILTFNTQDFARYPINVLDPAVIAASPRPSTT